jgi:predicted DNA-binding protein
MARTQIILTDEQHENLRRLAAQRSSSMGALVREAVELLLATTDAEDLARAQAALDRSFGAWRRDDDESAEQTVRRLRAEWGNRAVPETV